MGSRSTEPGHQSEVFRDQDGNMQVPSGAGIYLLNGSSFDIESGAHVRLKAGSGTYIHGTVVLSSAGGFNIGSGVLVNFTSGSTMTFSTGAHLLDENIVDRTSGTYAIPAYGVTVIEATANSTSRVLGVGKQGYRKTILIHSSHAIKIKASTQAKFGSSDGDPVLVFAAGQTSTQRQHYPRVVELIAESTKIWRILQYPSTTIMTLAATT